MLRAAAAMRYQFHRRAQPDRADYRHPGELANVPGRFDSFGTGCAVQQQTL